MKQETVDLMVKAERAIQSAENTMNDGDYDFAVSRVYYAMFYIASACLVKRICISVNTAGCMAHLDSISSRRANLMQSIKAGL